MGSGIRGNLGVVVEMCPEFLRVSARGDWRFTNAGSFSWSAKNESVR